MSDGCPDCTPTKKCRTCELITENLELEAKLKGAQALLDHARLLLPLVGCMGHVDEVQGLCAAIDAAREKGGE